MDRWTNEQWLSLIPQKSNYSSLTSSPPASLHPSDLSFYEPSLIDSHTHTRTHTHMHACTRKVSPGCTSDSTSTFPSCTDPEGDNSLLIVCSMLPPPLNYKFNKRVVSACPPINPQSAWQSNHSLRLLNE